jgi:beta-glucanase (GH16 family)
MILKETQIVQSLLFADEFDSAELNLNYWNFDLGDGSDRGIPGWGNSELQTYTSDNIALRDGLLSITARNNSSGQFTSSRITTLDKVSFDEGTIEIRARMPEGQGLWPAIWMLGDNITTVGWPHSGEIDIMEMRGDDTDKVTMTAHWSNLAGDHTYRGIPVTSSDKDFSEDFHIFALRKDSTSLTWLIDDEVYYSQDLSSYDGGEELQGQFHLLLNVAVGGHYTEGKIPNNLPQSMEIDYVRIHDLEVTRDFYDTSMDDDHALLKGINNHAAHITVKNRKALLELGDHSDEIQLWAIDIWGAGSWAQYTPYKSSGFGHYVPLIGKNRFDHVIYGNAGTDKILLTDEDDAYFLHDVFSAYNTKLLTPGNSMPLTPRFHGIETISGGSGDDLIDATSPSLSHGYVGLTLTGDQGNDILWGSAQDDLLFGGDGDDILNGGLGFNILNGGAGGDVFEITSDYAFHIIEDFDPSEGDYLRVLKKASDKSNILEIILADPEPILRQNIFEFDQNESVNHTTPIDFGGNNTIQYVDQNTGNHYIKVTKTLGAETWAGTTIYSLPEKVFINEKTLKVTCDIFSPKEDILVKLKLEDQNNPSHSVEVDMRSGTANAWETITFNFENTAQGTASFDSARVYNKASLFFDFGHTGDGSTYLVDNLTYSDLVTLETSDVIQQKMGNSFSDQINNLQLNQKIYTAVQYVDTVLIFNEWHTEDIDDIPVTFEIV